jgi:diguanylate cyclase (GGDEF)-like protein/PAS domain S-box-containing protein
LLFADGTTLGPQDHPARVTLSTGTALNGTLLCVEQPDGRQLWVSMSTRLLEGAVGADAGGVVTTIVDVTEARRGQEELERLALVARRTGDAVIICDGEGRIQWVNDAFTRLFGWTRDQCVGERPGAKLQGPETNPETIAAMGHATAVGESFSGEILNYRRDGSPIWIELTITPVTDDRSRVSHFISLAHDITARRNSARRMFQLSAAVSATDDGIAVIDSFQEFRFVNDAYANLFGYDRGDDLIGTSWRKLFDQAQLKRFDEVVLPNLWTGDRWRGEVVGRRRSGDTYPAEIAVTLLPGGSMVSVVRDITERKQRESEQARLTAILEATPDLVAISSAAGVVPYLNSAGRRMLGVAEAEELKLDDFFPDWARDIVRDVGIPAAENTGVWQGETALKRRDGQEVPVSQVIVAHRNSHGDVEYHSTIMRDITERKEAEDALRRMSIQDQLTGLYNRRGFFMLAQQALNTAARLPGHCLLFYFDVNDFKLINDTYGHHAGDQALQGIAGVLHECFRESDVLGRLGGDEFVAMAVNCLDPTGQILLSRLEERLGAHNETPGGRFKLSMGRGMARFDPADPMTLQQLLDVADKYLYEDKRVRKAAIKAAAALISDGA